MTNQTRWVLNEANSEITFSIRHLMIAHVHGKFNRFDASIYTTDMDFTTAVINLWMDVSSLCTGDVIRDVHLTSTDFFDVKNYKQIMFLSSSIEKHAVEGTYVLWGELTIKGIAKKIKLSVQAGDITTDHSGNEKAIFKITGLINRKNWGLVWNKAQETGGWMVSEDIALFCELELSTTNQKHVATELKPVPDHVGIF
jgi:polyisoprenoid-binding protein YceI